MKYFGDDSPYLLRHKLDRTEQRGRPRTTIVCAFVPGICQKKSSDLLQSILPLLFVDDKIDVTHAVLGLFTTEGHIIMRFEIYLRYPYLLWRLTSEFNAAGYATCILEFLETDDELLEFAIEARGTGNRITGCRLHLSDVRQDPERAVRHLLESCLQLTRCRTQDRPTEEERDREDDRTATSISQWHSSTVPSSTNIGNRSTRPCTQRRNS